MGANLATLTDKSARIVLQKNARAIESLIGRGLRVITEPPAANGRVVWWLEASHRDGKPRTLLLDAQSPVCAAYLSYGLMLGMGLQNKLG